jgi:hypothetical protein
VKFLNLEPADEAVALMDDAIIPRLGTLHPTPLVFHQTARGLNEERVARMQPLHELEDTRDGSRRIMDERTRQLHTLKFDAPNDDRYTKGELVKAAMCYENNAVVGDGTLPETWPFPESWWKPKGQVRDLEKAGALWMAEAARRERAGDTTGCANAGKNVQRIAAHIDAATVAELVFQYYSLDEECQYRLHHAYVQTALALGCDDAETVIQPVVAPMGRWEKFRLLYRFHLFGYRKPDSLWECVKECGMKFVLGLIAVILAPLTMIAIVFLKLAFRPFRDMRKPLTPVHIAKLRAMRTRQRTKKKP